MSEDPATEARTEDALTNRVWVQVTAQECGRKGMRRRSWIGVSV